MGRLSHERDWRCRRPIWARRLQVPVAAILLAGLVGERVSGACPPEAAIVEAPVTNAPLGALVSFCLQATGCPPFNYQWRKNGVDLPGETNACLMLTNITVGDGGSYRAGVFNESGAILSGEGLLLVTVRLLPGNDNFDNRRLLTAVSNSVSGDNSAATREPAEPLHFNRPGSNSVWYTWRAPATGIVTFDTR